MRRADSCDLCVADVDHMAFVCRGRLGDSGQLKHYSDDPGNDDLLRHGRDPSRTSCALSGASPGSVTYEVALSSVWPSVATVARGELRRFRLQPDVVEDLVQDAAAVVVRRRPAFETGEDLAPYVRVVVRRLAYRWLQKQSREVVGVVPERPVAHSVVELVEQRMRLRGTANAFAALPPQQKGHLRDYLRATERAGDARERARERKQIERIRAAMSRAIEGLAVALGWARDRFRWLDAAAPQVAGVAFAVTGIVALVLPTPGAQGRSTVSIGGVSPVVSTAAPAAASAANAGSRGDTPAPVRARQHAGSSGTDSPAGSRQRDVIKLDTPMGKPAGVRTVENPDRTFVCLLRSCVNYSDIPVPLTDGPLR